MRLNRRWLLAGFAAIVTITIVAAAPATARRLAFFRVREVEVVGAHYLDAADVARRLGLRPGASTFDALGPLRKAAAAIPGVLTATVERRLPGTLRVSVHEAIPVALVPLADGLGLIDSRGRVLPFDPARAPTSLPVASRDPATAALLERLMRTDHGWYDSVESAGRDHGDVVLDAGSHRIRLRPEADAGVLRGVTAVRAFLTQRGIPWREIDARYLNRVFVRKGPT